MKCSIVIPCYWANQRLIDLTSNCIDSIGQYTTDYDYEIILVDDASPLKMDGTYLTLPNNLGYAGAVNAGVERAKGDVYVILNNDTEVCPLWLESLTEPLKRGYDIMSIRTSDEHTGFNTEERVSDNDKFGSCWAIKSTVWHDLGGLDTRFGKGYFEDLDFYRRAREKGFKIGKNHEAVILHYGKQTFKDIDPEDTEYFKSLKLYEQKHNVKLTDSPNSW